MPLEAAIAEGGEPRIIRVRYGFGLHVIFYDILSTTTTILYGNIYMDNFIT